MVQVCELSSAPEYCLTSKDFQITIAEKSDMDSPYGKRLAQDEPQGQCSYSSGFSTVFCTNTQ